MNPIVKNILAFLAGVIIGGLLNAGIVNFGASLFPPPAGVDPNDLESIRSHMNLYTPKHFIIPYLAHILGSIVAAFIAAKISNNKLISITAGAFFLFGGLIVLYLIPETPIWFMILDTISYVPAAILGYLLGRKKEA